VGHLDKPQPQHVKTVFFSSNFPFPKVSTRFSSTTDFFQIFPIFYVTKKHN
jgi:hypothetical protein